MTRRTLLSLSALGAFSPLARGQYVTPLQGVINGEFSPTREEAAEIQRKLGELQQRLTVLRQAKIPDELIVEVEVYHKAAVFIDRHNEYFTKNSAAQTIAALDTGLTHASEIKAGNPSWTKATGTIIRAYRSRVDGSAQPYCVHVPSGYDGKTPQRMDVILHGTNRTMAEVQFIARASESRQDTDAVNYIQVELLGRTNNAYRWAGEADVFEAVEAAKRAYKIDDDRVVLRGFSMGGAGAWHLGLHRPDAWAAVEAGAGFTDTIQYARFINLPAHQLKALHIYDSRDYALNIFQLPTVGYGGEIDRQLAASVNVREQLTKEGFQFQPDGLNWTTKDLNTIFLVGPQTPHRWEPESKKRSDVFLNKAAERGRAEPDHIRFVTYTTRYNQCFWIRVDGLDQHYERAEVDAQRSDGGANIRIKTRNVSALSVTSPKAKKIVLDGKSFEASGALSFHKREGAWTQGEDKSVRKRHGLQGPIDDAFLDSFLCVRPSSRAANDIPGRYAEETLATFADDYSKFFRGDARTKDDIEITAADINDHNLILFGDPESNKLIAQVLGKLPFQWTAQKLTINGQSYDAATHTIAMIYPNPLHPNRYVVLNSGHTFHRNELASTNATLFPRFGDYAVLRLRQPVDKIVEAEIVTAGYFDEQWKLAKKS